MIRAPVLALALAAILAPSTADARQRGHHATRAAVAPTYLAPRAHALRPRLGPNPCAARTPGTCNWEEPAIHSLDRKCIGCHGIHPALDAVRASRPYDYELCRILPLHMQPACLNRPR